MIARFRSLLALLRRHPVKTLVAALLLGLLGAGAHQAGWYWFAEHHRRAAERALARYEFDEAREHLTACLRVRPRSALLHLELARAERRAGRYEQAVEHLETCQQLEGVTPENALERALLRAARGEVAATEGPLQEQVDRGSPEAPQILEALAQGYIRTYRLGNARRCLDRLLEREPDHVRALIWRASLRQSAGDDAGAEADYRRAVEAQPDHVGARCRLGEFLLRHARAEEALRQYEHLRPRPGGDQPAVLLGLARSHRQLGATDAARQALDDLLARQPHHADALVERGKLALEAESPAEAEGWLRRAVAASPFNAQANYALAQSLRRQGKEGAQQYEAAHDRIVSDRKRLEAVLVRVGKAPSDPAPRVEAGLICLRTGKEREGLRWLLSALQQAPRDGPTHAALADYYERAGQRDLAAQHRRQAEQTGAAGQPP
jgi:Tfp pilus assembly protein PilF